MRSIEMQHQTYADYLTWPDQNRDELVDGEVYVREPAPSSSHQAVLGELHRQLANALCDKPCRIYLAPFDVRLPKSTEPDGQVDTVVQPDLLIICDIQKIDARGMRGAPDWVAEVLSPSNATYDRRVKVRVYERAGVREVWLVNPIDRNLTVYQLDAGRYGRPGIVALEGQTRLAAIPGVSIDWGRVVARIL
jgi:Uma2 family endonuclease